MIFIVLAPFHGRAHDQNKATRRWFRCDLNNFVDKLFVSRRSHPQHISSTETDTLLFHRNPLPRLELILHKGTLCNSMLLLSEYNFHGPSDCHCQYSRAIYQSHSSMAPVVIMVTHLCIRTILQRHCVCEWVLQYS